MRTDNDGCDSSRNDGRDPVPSMRDRLRLLRTMLTEPRQSPVSNDVSLTRKAIQHELSISIRESADPTPCMKVRSLSVGSSDYDVKLEDAMQRIATKQEVDISAVRDGLGLWTRAHGISALDSTYRMRIIEDRERPDAKVGVIVIDRVDPSATHALITASRFYKLKDSGTYPLRWLVGPDHPYDPRFARCPTAFTNVVEAVQQSVICTLARDVDVLCLLIDGVAQDVLPERKETVFAERLWMSGRMLPVVTRGHAVLLCPSAPDHIKFLNSIDPATDLTDLKYTLLHLPRCASSEWVHIQIP